MDENALKHGPMSPQKLSWRFRTPPHDAKVPCGSCTLCCQGHQPIVVMEKFGDTPTQYLAESQGLNRHGEEVFYIDHQENGDCIYLDRAKGCTIHDRRPALCRSFDCAALKKHNTQDDMELACRAGVVSLSILVRGSDLMRAGYDPDD